MKRKTPERSPAGKTAGASPAEFNLIHPNAAGIDVGSERHWVAVPPDRDPQPVRSFRSFTTDLHRLADWLVACGIQTVAMESTGVYWIPLYEILEQRGLEVLLVNARHVKGVPGRKSDLVDCQWLQQLHSFGLLRGSFRPKPEIVALRSYLRHREQLVQEAASCIQRMQKILVLMNVQLHTVISDLTGVTGMRILREILSGETNPRKLARHRDRRCKASAEEIAASLTGHYQPEHCFALRQTVELYDVYQQKIRACDEQIEARLRELQAACEPPAQSQPAARTRKRPARNEPRFEIRSPLYILCGGVDLTQLPGIGPYNALRLLSEIGVDMSRWPTEHHFASWMTLSPNPKITGGKVLSSHTQPSANRAAKILRLAIMSISRSDHALAAFYRRLATRIGKAKAITAAARKLALLVYRLLKDKLPYREQTAADYDARQKRRILRGLRRRAEQLGYRLIDTETGELLGAAVS
jgi:transposase